VKGIAFFKQAKSRFIPAQNHLQPGVKGRVENMNERPLQDPLTQAPTLRESHRQKPAELASRSDHSGKICRNGVPDDLTLRRLAIVRPGHHQGLIRTRRPT